MINPIKQVAKYARLARKHPTKLLSDAWLEYQYGWRPALSTIHSLCNMNSPSGFGLVHARGRCTKLNSFVSKNLVQFPIEGSTTSFDNFVSHDDKYSYEIKVWVKSPLSGTAADISRYTSLNPLSIAWELLPYSFVIDWFIDIGSYIRNYETSFLYQPLFSHGYTSRRFVETAKHIKCVPRNGTGYFTGNGNNYTSVTFNRSLLLSYPLPKVPPINPDLGSSRLLSAAALLRGLLR